ncbi:MAG: hypothetical protein IJX81_07155 [Clostridia bacterium]|nr:hypothetical protein [Clostridia bacterium]
MKKFLLLLLCFTLLFGLSACGNETSNSSTGGNSINGSSPSQNGSSDDIDLPIVNLP